MDRMINRFAAGTSYGPVLSQTDLYLLNTDLEINPLLTGAVDNQPLQFHLVTGFSTNSRVQGDTSIVGKDEPATLPRVSQIIVICRASPWCTIVKRDTGVTIGDICTSIYKDYTENEIQEAEFNSLNPRAQEQLRRTSHVNLNQSQPQQSTPWGFYGTPQPASNGNLRRVDWLRERVYFEGLTKDDGYAKSRLGFRAPNIFVMELTS